MLFNGSNTDAQSKVIYEQWLKKYATLIERDIELIDFIKEHDIGDDGFLLCMKETEAKYD